MESMEEDARYEIIDNTPESELFLRSKERNCQSRKRRRESFQNIDTSAMNEFVCQCNQSMTTWATAMGALSLQKSFIGREISHMYLVRMKKTGMNRTNERWVSSEGKRRDPFILYTIRYYCALSMGMNIWTHTTYIYRESAKRVQVDMIVAEIWM